MIAENDDFENHSENVINRILYILKTISEELPTMKDANSILLELLEEKTNSVLSDVWTTKQYLFEKSGGEKKDDGFTVI